MARAIWRGAISFGMVSIPVRLMTVRRSNDIGFRQLHREDMARIKQLRWCPQHEREVPQDEIARGYEYAKDHYVVVEDEDFEKLPVPSKRTIALSAFVAAAEIDPVFYENAYRVEPEESGVKPFVLLLRALEEKGLTALAKVSLGNKERLCALRPGDEALVLETLYYPDEIEQQDGRALPAVEISAAELQMANVLIDMLHKPFRPEDYHDEYRQALMAIIRTKVEGGEVVEAEAPPVPQTVDLMAALKASVEAATARQAAAPPAAAEPTASPARSKTPAKAKARAR